MVDGFTGSRRVRGGSGRSPRVGYGLRLALPPRVNGLTGLRCLVSLGLFGSRVGVAWVWFGVRPGLGLVLGLGLLVSFGFGFGFALFGCSGLVLYLVWRCVRLLLSRAGFHSPAPVWQTLGRGFVHAVPRLALFVRVVRRLLGLGLVFVSLFLWDWSVVFALLWLSLWLGLLHFLFCCSASLLLFYRGFALFLNPSLLPSGLARPLGFRLLLVWCVLFPFLYEPSAPYTRAHGFTVVYAVSFVFRLWTLCGWGWASAGLRFLWRFLVLALVARLLLTCGSRSGCAAFRLRCGM